jgi:hypothetical protein
MQLRAIPLGQKQMLGPLLDLLNLCLEQGPQAALERLQQAALVEPNPRGMLPLVASLAADAPRFTAAYTEFGRPAQPKRAFHRSAVHCGTRDAGDSKEFFQIANGGGKLPEAADQLLSPLRAQQLLDARKHIGLGIVLEATDEGELFMTRFIHHSFYGNKIFKLIHFSYARRPLQVQSHYLDREAMRSAEDAAQTKHVIYQKATIKVYDLWQSFQLMCQWIVQKGGQVEEPKVCERIRCFL